MRRIWWGGWRWPILSMRLVKGCNGWRSKSLLMVSIFLLAGLGGEAQRGRPPGAASRETASIAAFEIGDAPGGVRWASLLDYYRRVDQQSDRLEMRELGRTTQGRRQVALFISAPHNLAALNRIGGPVINKPSGDAGAPAKGPLVVLLTAGQERFEVEGTLALTRLLHRLLTERSPALTRILDEVVVIVVPSLDPDGTDISAEQFAGSPGSTPVAINRNGDGELGRDFDAFTLVETQLLVDKVLNQRRPHVWYNVRQGGTAGSKPIYLTTSLLARQLLRNGRIEAKKERLGSPAAWSRQHATLYIEAQAAGRGASSTLSASKSGPAPSAELANLLPIESAAFNFLEQVLQHSGAIMAERHRLVTPHAASGRERRWPAAYLLPEPMVPDSISQAYQRLTDGLREVTGSEDEQHAKTEALYNEAVAEPSTSREIRYFYQTEGLDRMLAILKRGGIEVRRTDQELTLNGRTWPRGTHIVRMDQPFAAFAHELLDPLSGESPGGGSLPLLLNVEVVRVDEPVQVESRPEPMAVVIQERVRENGGVRVGVYRAQPAVADEGWIRWLFDQYRFGYVSLTEKELGEPDMATRFDALILPDQAVGELERGRSAGAAAGGIGAAGIRGLRGFVEAGGTLITFNRASVFAVRHLKLPIRTRVGSGAGSASILRIEVDPADPLALGVGRESIACFENGPVFEVTDQQRARVVARYPVGKGRPLWLDGQGPSLAQLAQLGDRAALVEVRLGRGRVILFGFRPLYRGRSLANYPFIFNALMTSGRSGNQ